MGVLAFFFFAALTVREDATALRAGCDDGDALIARLPAGAPAEVKYALNGCLSVIVRGETGYLPASALNGVETWEAERRNARAVDQPRMAQPRLTEVAMTGNALAQASDLLVNQRPAEALEILERELIQRPRDPQLLALAGAAALRSDAAQRAAGYLQDSFALRPDPSVERLLAEAVREVRADRSSRQLESMRFSLRYDPAVMTAETARGLVAVLEQEFSRVSSEIGCRTAERVAVIAQSREAYLASTGAAEWSGGLYDGRIRVAALEPGGAGPETRKAFSHEIVHACLAATGQWPAWFHEALAQKLSGEVLSQAARERVRAAARANQLPSLALMTHSWPRMSPQHAALAYAAALYAMELFYEHYREFGIRNLVKSPEQLPRFAAGLDRLMRE